MRYYKVNHDKPNDEFGITYQHAVELLSKIFPYKEYDKNHDYINGIPERLADEGEINCGEFSIICRGEPLRICSTCGEPVLEGYMVDFGILSSMGDIEYYCCGECLEAQYTREEYDEMYEADEAFWTSWLDAYEDDEIIDIWGMWFPN